MQVKPNVSDSASLTFSIIARIFLPKAVSESTGRLFSKWLKEKYSSQIFSQNMLKLVEKYKVVYDSWLVVTERKQIQQVPQFFAIYQTVSLFEGNRVSRQFLFSFFAMIVQSINSGTSKKAFITQILGLNIPKSSNISVPTLIQHALKIFEVIPKRKQAIIIKPTEILMNDNEQEEPPVEQPVQPPPIPINLAKRISASYVKVNVEPSKNPIALITNNVSKSVASGSEGQLTEHVSESIRFISELQIHMYTIFETLVRADQLYRAILYKGSMEGILLKNAVQALYGPYAKEILCFPYEVIMPIVRERCAKEMNEVFDARTQTENHVDLMTNHMPRFDFSPTISFSTRSEPFRFQFSAHSKLVADLLSRIGHIHSQDFVYFLDTLMPLFVLTRKDERLCIIGTDTICNALFLFSRCATAIDHFFAADFQEGSSLSDIIRAAECEASLKYSAVTNTQLEEFLEDFLKKFFANDYKFYELVEEAEGKYGLASRDLFTLIMYITQLDALCSRFAAQFKLTKFSTLAKFYSRESGPDAKKRLDARFKLYEQSMKRILISPLVKIEMSYGNPEAVITRI